MMEIICGRVLYLMLLFVMKSFQNGSPGDWMKEMEQCYYSWKQ